MTRFRAICTACALAALAGCGADGEPVPPSMNATMIGIGIGAPGASDAAGPRLDTGGFAFGPGIRS